MKSTDGGKGGRGSITVFFAMMSACLAVLLLVLLESARIKASRFVFTDAAETAMDCLLASYQRETFERYGLLFYDAGRGGGSIDPEDAEAEYARWFDKNAEGAFLSLWAEEVRLTSAVSAADYNGAVFRDSALRCEALREEDADTVRFPSAEALSAGFSRAASAEESAVIPAEFAALPFPSIVLPEGSALSGYGISPEDLPSVSQRDFREMPPEERFSGTEGLSAEAENRLFLRFLDREFPCFTEGDSGFGLACEKEYLLFGGRTDAENLEEAARKLFAVRAGTNARALRSSENLMREFTALFAEEPEEGPEGAGGEGADAAEESVPDRETLIRLCAAAEALSDLRILFSGGSVEEEKTEAGWLTRGEELRELAAGNTAASGPQSAGPNGPGRQISYREYLDIFLYGQDQALLSYRAMDMVQDNLREYCGSFCFCSLLFYMTVEVTASEKGLFAAEPLVYNTTGRRAAAIRFGRTVRGSYR